jgi:serpin B
MASGLALASVVAEAQRSTAGETGGQQAAAAGSALGVDLYRSFASRDGNVVFSPYGVSRMVALLSSGAVGKTREQLLAALHWGQSHGQLADAFEEESRSLDRPLPDGVTLLNADALWYQRGGSANQAFLKLAKDRYGADVRAVDFTGDAPAVVGELNTWVETKTLGRITDMVPARAIGASTRIVLANAVYFKGRWEHPFKADQTEPRPFLIRPGSSVMTPQMTETEDFKVSAGPTCDLLELPYAGGDLSMVILLPRTPDGLPALERTLDASSLLLWLATLDFSRPRHMHVTLPKFKMTYSAELTDALRRAGVTAAFDPKEAEFSAIDGARDLSVSTVLHKAFVDVNEEGTEAAASSVMVMESFGVERSDEFKVDHPFLFLIRDNSTDTLLFLGRVVDPRAN